MGKAQCKENMIIQFFLLLLFVGSVEGAELVQGLPQLTEVPIPVKVIRKLPIGSSYVKVEVKSGDKDQKPWQSFDYRILGKHPNSCQVAFRKLSLYEQYQDFISFVKRSSYDEKTQMLDFLFNHTLLPYPIGLKFKLPRIKGVGIYPFTFPTGLLAGLNGEIWVLEKDQKCYLFGKALWRGEDTKIPDLVFEIFSSKLSNIAAEKLMRMSKF